MPSLSSFGKKINKNKYFSIITDCVKNDFIFKSGNLQHSMLLLSRFSRVQLGATPWTAAYQAPPIMGFSRQEYWSGLPLPSPPTLHSQ